MDFAAAREEFRGPPVVSGAQAGGRETDPQGAGEAFWI